MLDLKSKPSLYTWKKDVIDFSSNSSYIPWAKNTNSWPGASTSKGRDEVTQNRTAANQQSCHKTHSVHSTSLSVHPEWECKGTLEVITRTTFYPTHESSQNYHQRTEDTRLKVEGRQDGKWCQNKVAVEENLVRREGCRGAGKKLLAHGKDGRKYTSGWGPWSYLPGPWLRETGRSTESQWACAESHVGNLCLQDQRMNVTVWFRWQNW